jgi:hypothetical protein
MTVTTHSQYPLVSVADAQQIIEKQSVSLKSEEVGLQDALGRVLAQPVLARDDLPPFPASIKVRTTMCAPVEIFCNFDTICGHYMASHFSSSVAVRLFGTLCATPYATRHLSFFPTIGPRIGWLRSALC